MHLSLSLTILKQIFHDIIVGIDYAFILYIMLCCDAHKFINFTYYVYAHVQYKTCPYNLHDLLLFDSVADLIKSPNLIPSITHICMAHILCFHQI